MMPFYKSTHIFVSALFSFKKNRIVGDWHEEKGWHLPQWLACPLGPVRGLSRRCGPWFVGASLGRPGLAWNPWLS